MKIPMFLKKIFRKESRLIDQLPPLNGYLSENEPLHKKNWFGVGGRAEIYFEPADCSDLERLIRFMPPVPLTVLGAGSNVLIRDGGIPGIVVHLGRSFSEIRVQDQYLVCGAGSGLMEVSRVAAQNGLGGLEFMCGIPGSVGGAIRMNAGAHGRSIQDILVSLQVMTREGDLLTIDPQETNIFSYRKCCLPDDWIFVEATLKGTPDDLKNIQEKMKSYKKMRESSQPLGVKTAGSTFKNPEGLKAWQLIEKNGLKGMKIGDAVVSEKHANFLINKGQASARDIERLGEKIRSVVLEKEGIALEWEVKKMGVEKDFK